MSPSLTNRVPPIGRESQVGSPTGRVTGGRTAARRWDLAEREGRSPERTLAAAATGRMGRSPTDPPPRKEQRAGLSASL